MNEDNKWHINVIRYYMHIYVVESVNKVTQTKTQIKKEREKQVNMIDGDLLIYPQRKTCLVEQ